MKKQYLRKVSRLLLLPRKQKKALLADLEEAFASAAEHGESEAEVIRRLGPASDLAAELHESAGISARQAVLLRRIRLLSGALVVMLFGTAAVFIWNILLHASSFVAQSTSGLHVLHEPAVSPLLWILLALAVLGIGIGIAANARRQLTRQNKQTRS